MRANRAYLVNLTNSFPVTLNLTGRPALRSPVWVPDAYNLRGFPVDGKTPPTFTTFFQPSTAHYTSGKLQNIYRLAADGQWSIVAPTDTVQAGVAYWVFTKGGSSYQGPLSVSLDLGDGLDFGGTLTRAVLHLKNVTSGLGTTTLTLSSATDPNGMGYQGFDAANGMRWLDLPVPYGVALGAGGSLDLNLSPLRVNFSTASYQALLEVKDGVGTRYLVPVSASLQAASAGVSPKDLHGAKGLWADTSLNHVGLWVGSASLNAVSEVHSGGLVTNLYALVGTNQFLLTSNYLVSITNWVVATNYSVTTNGGVIYTNYAGLSTNPVVAGAMFLTNRNTIFPVYPRVERSFYDPTTTPATNGFNLRLIVHVDSSGVARLLREVTEMWQEGTYTNASDGSRVLAKAGHSVLVTDRTLLGSFRGAVLRDGQTVGRRISTSAFNFDADPAQNSLTLAGGFALNSSLAATNYRAATSPTNPFRHKYHPDHAAGYAYSRAIQLAFSPDNIAGNQVNDYGYGTMAGTYRETISGLHKTNLFVSGSFTLRRVSTVGLLNQ